MKFKINILLAISLSFLLTGCFSKKEAVVKTVSGNTQSVSINTEEVQAEIKEELVEDAKESEIPETTEEIANEESLTEADNTSNEQEAVTLEKEEIVPEAETIKDMPTDTEVILETEAPKETEAQMEAQIEAEAETQKEEEVSKEEVPIETETPAVNTVAALSSSDFKSNLNGVSVGINSDATSAVSSLGDGYSFVENASCNYDGMDKIYTYQGFTIYTYPDGEKDFVSEIEYTSDSIKTSRGIKINSTKNDVINAYGDNFSNEGKNMVYKNGGQILRFRVSNDVVVGISIGKE